MKDVVVVTIVKRPTIFFWGGGLVEGDEEGTCVCTYLFVRIGRVIRTTFARGRRRESDDSANSWGMIAIVGPVYSINWE